VPVKDISDDMMKMMKATLPRITKTVKTMSLSKLISLVFFFLILQSSVSFGRSFNTLMFL